MTYKNLSLTTCLLVLISFAGSDLLGAEENPRKTLVTATRNLMKMSMESGYRTRIMAVGGFSEYGDHRIDRPKIALRCSADVRGPLMHMPDLFAYIKGDKGAIEHGGHWKHIRSTPKGKAIQGLLNVPTELLMDALRRGSRVEWKIPGKVIEVTLAQKRSQNMFTEMNNSGCVRVSDLIYSHTESRIDGSNTLGTLKITLDQSGELPQRIEFTLLTAFRNEQGRSARGELAFQEGMPHLSFQCCYRLDTGAAVGEMRLPKDLLKLLK